jgi:acyl-CoA thioesterase
MSDRARDADPESTCPIARDMFAADTASRALGIEIAELAPGRATATMAVRESMVNGHGITHGGYVFTLADTAFALACNSRDARAVAAHADIRFIAATQLGDELRAEAVERALYGRSGIYDVSVWRGETLVAEFRGHSRTIG